jgi:hypothetical protein
MTAALEPRLLTQRLVIVGRSGYGKTNVAKGSGVEPLLAARGRVGIMDPTDSWYGLRTKPDGKTPAYKVVIFGGEHGDLPLNEDAGAVMGRALAKAEDSWIISLDSMKTEHAREKFAAAFLESLYEFNRSPINLIIDEAETFAPQNAATPLQNTMTSRVNSIVKRGRKRGFVPWLITQRPADVSKAVISQADALIALNLTLPHDRNAIMSYVKDHDEDGTAAAMFKAMPSLPRGEAIVWWPGGKILERRKFPLSRTFDSGKAPELGDKAIQLKPLKVGALEKALADVIADRDAKDPAKLQAKILELERKVAAQGSAPSPAAVAQARAEGTAAGRAAMLADAGGQVRKRLEQLKVAIAGVEGVAGAIDADLQRLGYGKPAPKASLAAIGTTAKVAAAVDRRLAELERAPPAPRSTPAPRPNGDDGAKIGKGEGKILQTLAQYHPAPLEAGRLGAIAGFSPNGGTFRTYISRLRTAGLIEDGTPYRLTATGFAQAGPVDPLPTGAQLLEHWAARVGAGEAKILRALAARGGEATAQELGAATGFEANGGTFRTYISRLRTLALIEGKGTLTLQSDLRS